jgi:hypothetical protein
MLVWLKITGAKIHNNHPTCSMVFKSIPPEYFPLPLAVQEPVDVRKDHSLPIDIMLFVSRYVRQDQPRFIPASIILLEDLHCLASDPHRTLSSSFHPTHISSPELLIPRSQRHTCKKIIVVRRRKALGNSSIPSVVTDSGEAASALSPEQVCLRNRL